MSDGAKLRNKRINMNKFEIVKYQLMTHCFVKGIVINDTELNLLALMGELGKMRLTEFCEKAAARQILSTAQAVRQCLSKLAYSNLMVKDGGGLKHVRLNPDLDILSDGNIVINLMIVKLEPATKAQHAVQKNGREVEPAGAVH